MLSKIFSIKDYSEIHKVVTILGIKIKFQKPELAKKRKENSYYYYKKNNIDITTLPPATGQIRDIQLANLVLLKELDYVCKQNNLTYWLDGGTLIGAIRHKGFIPWDDDIDTAMLRQDYEKIIDAFKQSSRNPDIYADYFYSELVPTQVFIKVQHKKCPNIFVDIFPFDLYGEKMDTKEELKKTKEIKKILKNLKNSSGLMTKEEFINQNKKVMEDKILVNQIPEDKNNATCVWGIDFHHRWNNWFTKYNVIFPLKTIVFEGNTFPCINNPDAFLKRVYGSYMSYPDKIKLGHSAYLELTEEEKEIIEELNKNE